MDKQQLILALQRKETVKYDKNKFVVTRYDDKLDVFYLLHKDHISDPDMEYTLTPSFINYAKIKLTDKIAKGEMCNMKNVKYKIDGKKLIIEIDLDEKHGKSNSGKNVIVATTGGNAKIEGTDMIMGLNLYTKDVV
jgi:hypothetical protein